MKPLRNHVIVKQLEEDALSDIIVTPESYQEKAGKGKVISIGMNTEVEFEVGDVVLFPKYAGTKLKDDMLLLVCWDVQAVLEI